VATLERTVRFAVNDPSFETAAGPNGFAGSPAMRGLGRHYELTVRCSGRIDERTGYLIDIKTIDKAVRATVMPRIVEACHRDASLEPATLMPELVAVLSDAIAASNVGDSGAASLESLEWKLTPTYGVAMHVADRTVAMLRQRFDFAAAHRLHAPRLTDEENRRAFGKCNNPSGHGHNYQFEPLVAVPLPKDGGQADAFSLVQLEEIVQRELIEPFDHKHLNLDTAEFATTGGAIPSVENIARVFYERLGPAIAAHGATLRAITVWETDRTSCTYPG
jgi:6-pyruvoyltetrahydropterin/6-carboxytetrahydropterin synthase